MRKKARRRDREVDDGLSPTTRDMDKYQKIEKLGEGTYGTHLQIKPFLTLQGIVYKAQNKESTHIVALKRIRLDNEEEVNILIAQIL